MGDWLDDQTHFLPWCLRSPDRFAGFVAALVLGMIVCASLALAVALEGLGPETFSLLFTFLWWLGLAAVLPIWAPVALVAFLVGRPAFMLTIARGLEAGVPWRVAVMIASICPAVAGWAAYVAVTWVFDFWIGDWTKGWMLLLSILSALSASLLLFRPSETGERA